MQEYTMLYIYTILSNIIQHKTMQYNTYQYIYRQKRDQTGS